MLLKTKINLYETQNGNTKMQWLLALLLNTTLVTYGLQAGWISPMVDVLQSNSSPIGLPLSNNELSWIASILCIFGTVGVPFYSYFADAYGRKWSVIVIALLQSATWIAKICVPTKTGLIIGRIFCGLASAGCFSVIPMYVKEISQDDMRGTLGSLLIFSQNIGYLTIYLLGAYLGYHTLLYVVVCLPILTTVLMLKATESPVYLVKMGKIDEAVSATALLRGLSKSDKVVQSEVESMRSEDIYYKEMPQLTLRTIMKNQPWRRATIIVGILMTLQAMNGAFAVITFASTLMSSSDLPIDPQLQTLAIPVVLIIGSLTAMSSVEKFGRRVPLVICFSLASISIMTLASILLIQERGGAVPGILVVSMLVTSVFAYSAGINSIPYVILSEMFNFEIRAKITGLIITYAWFCSFIQISVFGPISSALGMSTMFFVFAGINVLGVVATLVILPETKGKSVEQIEEVLRRK